MEAKANHCCDVDGPETKHSTGRPRCNCAWFGSYAGGHPRTRAPAAIGETVNGNIHCGCHDFIDGNINKTIDDFIHDFCFDFAGRMPDVATRQVVQLHREK